MTLSREIDHQLNIRPEPHPADVILLNTPIGDIDMDAIKEDRSRMIRVLQAAGMLHDRALLATQMVNGNIVVPEAIVSTALIGGESAAHHGGQRGRLGLRRYDTDEGAAIGPIKTEAERGRSVAARMSPGLRAAILTV